MRYKTSPLWAIVTMPVSLVLFWFIFKSSGYIKISSNITNALLVLLIIYNLVDVLRYSLTYVEINSSDVVSRGLSQVFKGHLDTILIGEISSAKTQITRYGKRVIITDKSGGRHYTASFGYFTAEKIKNAIQSCIAAN